MNVVDRTRAGSGFEVLAIDDALVRDRSGRGVRVAILDSGVNRGNPHLGPIQHGYGIGPTGRAREDFLDTLGHGTAVAAAIQEKAPDVEIIAVKVFHDELATTLPGLLGGLERALDDGVCIVNLSLGSPRPEHQAPLREAAARFLDRGVLIVSPCEHRGMRWWPGGLPGVAGVLLDWSCPRDQVRLMRTPAGHPVFRASGYPRPIAGVPREHNFRGISFAAANVTGLLARLLEGRPSVRSVEDVSILLSSRPTATPNGVDSEDETRSR